MKRARRESRVLALKTLFEVDVVGHAIGSVLERQIAESAYPDELGEFARHLASGVAANRERIDALIGRLAPAWPFEQMAVVDRNVLRIAIFELLFDNRRAPPKAVVSEAVSIGKLFGGESTAKLVNGVLGSVMVELSTLVEREDPTEAH